MTPSNVFNKRVEEFISTLDEAKVVKKNQVLRILELYAVMMLIIIISWIIYAIFKVKEPAGENPYESDALDENRRSR